MWAWLPLLAGFPLIMEETVRGNGHSEERMGDEMGDGQKRVGPGAVAPEAQLHAVSSHSFRSQYTLLLSKIVCMHIHPLQPHRSVSTVGIWHKERPGSCCPESNG